MSEENAICVPSGDHEGSNSVEAPPVLVEAPAAAISKISAVCLISSPIWP